jgi:proline iminopeptidase
MPRSRIFEVRGRHPSDPELREKNLSKTASAALRTILAGILMSPLAPAGQQAGNEKGPLVVDGLRRINGTLLYCKSVGTGVPLVIIHGGPGLDHSYLLPQMEKLADRCELIFFDQRGCGKSSARLDSSAMTLDALVEDIDKVRDAYNLNTMNLMGHSWGGLLAMFYAIKHGDRLNSLILVNSTPPTSELRAESFKVIAQRTSHEDSTEQALLTQTEEFKRRDPAAMRKFFRLLFRGSFTHKEMIDDLTLSFPPDYGARSKLLQYLAKDPQLQSYDLLSQLETITCPVLIIGSDNDITPPGSTDLIHTHIRDSRYILMKSCGHFPFIEAPTQFFPAVSDFIEKYRQR